MMPLSAKTVFGASCIVLTVEKTGRRMMGVKHGGKTEEKQADRTGNRGGSSAGCGVDGGRISDSPRQHTERIPGLHGPKGAVLRGVLRRI